MHPLKNAIYRVFLSTDYGCTISASTRALDMSDETPCSDFESSKRCDSLSHCICIQSSNDSQAANNSDQCLERTEPDTNDWLLH